MTTLLMNLRHVPDDEADEVRALLREHGIRFYETPPNRWGLSMGAIWIRDEGQVDQARQLLADYQRARQERARAAYEERKQAGETDTFFSLVSREPLQVLLYLAAAAAVLFIVVAPFVQLARSTS